MLEPRKCCICGTEFVPLRANIRACRNPECKIAARRERQRVWYKKNYLSARTQKRDYMRKVREETKLEGPHVRKPDTIIGEGYAERQIQSTLAMVGRVKPEL